MTRVSSITDQQAAELAATKKRLAMQLSPIFHVVPEEGRTGDTYPGKNLKPGDQLIGRVLRLDSDGSAFIDLGRFRAQAHIGFPVQPGQMIKLQVVQAGMPLQLQADVKLTGQAPTDVPQLDFTQVLSLKDQQQLVSVLDRLVQHANSVSLSNQWPDRVQLTATNIKTLFDNIPIDKPISQLVQWLQNAVEDRGILFEKKLADALAMVHPSADGKEADNIKHLVRSVMVRDLKPQLLYFKAFLESSVLQKTLPEDVTVKSLSMIRHSIEKLLNHLVQQQDRAVSNWRDGDTFQIFTHMLPFEEQKLPVKIKIHYPKKNDRIKEGRHQRIALLLQMDRIGSVRADIAMAKRHLKIQIFVQKNEIRQLFEMHSDDVTLALKSLFEEVVLTTAVSEEKIALFSQEGQRGASLGRIDIQV